MMSLSSAISNPLVARRSSRRAGNGGSSSRRRVSYTTPRAAARTEFASFFPDEVTALEEPAAVAMAKKCKHIATPVQGRDKPVMTSCVGAPAPAGKNGEKFQRERREKGGGGGRGAIAVQGRSSE